MGRWDLSKSCHQQGEAEAQRCNSISFPEAVTGEPRAKLQLCVCSLGTVDGDSGRAMGRLSHFFSKDGQHSALGPSMLAR